MDTYASGSSSVAMDRHWSGFDPSFSPGGTFSVGAEEELLMVDEHGSWLGPGGASMLAVVSGTSPCGGLITGEVFVDQVELNTPVCASSAEVASSLQTLRSRVASCGARLIAVGVHPTASFGRAQLSTSPRYDAIAAEYGGLLRTPTSALQVHVGMPDSATLMSVYRGMRHRLPLLRALAASSPFWHGVDSGLASARAAILRSYPRATGAPLLRSWDEYIDHTNAVLAAAGVPDHTYVWWDLRPRPDLGTLEVRVMDAQPSLGMVAGLTALVQGMARWVADKPGDDDLPDVVLTANDHCASHHGLDADVLDVCGKRRPMRELGAVAVRQARAALSADGLAGALDAVERMLVEPSEAMRQRALVAAHGTDALLSDLVERTSGEPKPLASVLPRPRHGN